MNKYIPAPVCSTVDCGSMMVLKTKGEDQFWGCPAWKERGCKTMPYDLNQKKKEVIDGDVMIMDELKAINDRLDLMARYLQEHLK